MAKASRYTWKLKNIIYKTGGMQQENH